MTKNEARDLSILRQPLQSLSYTAWNVTVWPMFTTWTNAAVHSWWPFSHCLGWYLGGIMFALVVGKKLFISHIFHTRWWCQLIYSLICLCNVMAAGYRQPVNSRFYCRWTTSVAWLRLTEINTRMRLDTLQKQQPITLNLTITVPLDVK